MPLGTPTLTATLDTDGAVPFVAITVSCTGMAFCTVSRVTAAGVLAVRGMEDVPPTGPDLFYGADYEVPQADALSYIAVITDGLTSVTVGPVSTSVGLDRGGDFVWPVGRPNESMEIYVESIDDRDYDIAQGSEYVIDRPDPVVLTHNRHWAQGKATFLTLEDDERIAFSNMIFTGRILVFSPRPGMGFEELEYWAVGKVSEQRTSTAGREPSRRWLVDYQRVAMPPAQFFVTVGDTWQDVFNAGRSWVIITSSGDDWQELGGL